MARGTTTTAVQGKSKIIEYVPGTRLLLSGIKIPYWDEMLILAIKAQEASGLGFLGADVAIDRDNGPVFLELNARPGLSIQVANMAGLKRRLERVEGLKIKSAIRGAAVGKNLFGGEIEEEVEGMSGKNVIGSIEEIKIIGKNNTEIKTKAKIDTGAYSTSIDTKLAKSLGFEHVINEFDKIDLTKYEITPKNEKSIKKAILAENKIPDLVDVAVIFASSGSSIRPIVKTKFTMDKKIIPAQVNIIDRSDMKYDIIIGKRNLHQFLVDVSK